MIERFTPGVGAVFSADIAVPEHEREVRFYSRVLGTGGALLWREDLMSIAGLPIIGLGEHTAEFAHLPLHWMPHIQVEDVAVSLQRAVDLGGSVLMHDVGDDGASRWAVLLDPWGAAFGIIPVVAAEAMPEGDGAASPDEAASIGRIRWLDLTVANASSARDFYRQVIGWSVEDVEMREGEARYADFTMLGADGTPVAGVCHARGVNVGLPPVWMIYLPVGDLAESVHRVEDEGGTVIKAMRGRQGEYLHAVIQDPVGACLALTQA